MNKTIIITLEREEALATVQGAIVAIGAAIAQPIEQSAATKDQLVFLCHLVREIIAQVAQE
jgi:hypothetical protein